MRITVDGTLPAHVTAKDVILAIIAKIGIGGGVGHAIEYGGSTIRSMDVEGRMTICNMSIEAGARIGMIAPDDAAYEYIHGRAYAPQGADWDRALTYWRTLPSDPEARFDRELTLAAEGLAPMVSWGTNPEESAPITGRVPDPAAVTDTERRKRMERALDYMRLRPGTAFTDVPVDRVFIGSCTNSRIEDLRLVAQIVGGHRVHPAVRAMVVPGSAAVRRQAEDEGLDKVFEQAGFEWRRAGCSMCLGMNPDVLAPGERCASTSNRNFEGRQGKGGRTHLVSPGTAAAAALTGRLSDVREFAAA
jgi:3-isopropylmalate/(R)-2-methylmalate dehydratase large subunit